jgi:Tol biopolymer transport system component
LNLKIKLRFIGVRAVCGFIGFWILSFGFPCLAATWLDPALKWKTMETPHFSIHYYDEIKETAVRFAPIAEEVHATMSKVFQYAPDRRTQVVLLDTSDYPNGFTDVFMYPCVTLYITDFSSNLNPYKYDDYLRFLFIHEYSHVLHLSIAEGRMGWLQKLFGQTIFPNAVEPWYMIEGIATYMETQYSKGGRGADPRWEMLLRMDVLEDNLKTLDQASVTSVRWPTGKIRYLYGVKFIEYLCKTYGEDKLIYLAHHYGDLFIPFGLNQAFLYIYGKNSWLLWDEWLAYEKNKYLQQKTSLGDTLRPRLLTTSGYYHAKPKWDKEGRYIYYLEVGADEYSEIRRVEPSSEKNEKVIEGLVMDDNFCFSPDGKAIIFAKSDIYKNYYHYKDICRFDLEKKELSRLTDGLRATDPALSPDGKTLTYILNDKGTRRVKIGDRVFGDQDEQYFSPVYSPDGKYLTVVKRPEDIFLIYPDSGAERRLTEGANPCFSPDGKFILYESDRTGIVNLYAHELKTGKTFQITNALGGAMMPDVSPDRKQIAYIYYSSSGYDVACMEFDPQSWKEVNIAAKDQSVSVKLIYPPVNLSAPVPYNPVGALLPKFWLPMFYSNESGMHSSVNTTGFDPLKQHFYYLNFGYDFNIQRPAYELYYINNQYFPKITLGLLDQSASYSVGGSGFWEREKTAYLTFSLINNRMYKEYDSGEISFGLKNIQLSNLTNISAFNPQPSQGNLGALTLSGRYRDDRSYLFSISPEDGNDFRLGVESYSPLIGSDYTFTNFSGQWNSYFKSPLKHHVLASALMGFYSRGEQMVQSNFTWRYLQLRGYPSGYLKGNKGSSLSLEYRYPVLYIEKSFLMGIAFIDRLWGSFFLDAGAAGSVPVSELTLKKGAGVEFTLNTKNFLGYLPVIIKYGYAQGLDAGGEAATYLSISL